MCIAISRPSRAAIDQMDVGERVLLPAVRRAPADVSIVANGFSCREQIQHGTNRLARHFAELVSDTIGGAR